MMRRMGGYVLVLLAACCAAGAQNLGGISPNAIPAGSAATAFQMTLLYSSGQYNFCFYTGFGTNTPNVPSSTINSPMSASFTFTVPGAQIDAVSPNAFSGGNFTAKVYPVAASVTTCSAPAAGTYDSVTLSLPTVTGISLTSAYQGNPALGAALPAAAIVTGTNFVPPPGSGYGSTVYFSNTAAPGAATTTYLSATELRVALPSNTSGYTYEGVSVCNNNVPGTVYCTAAQNLPLTALTANPGTVTASPNPATTSQGVALTASFGPAQKSVAGAPSGLVTFRDSVGNATQTAPLILNTSASFVQAPTTTFGSSSATLATIQPLTADFNHDGIPDLLLVDAPSNGSSNVPVLHFLLGTTPAGSFAAATSYSLPTSVVCKIITSVAVADFTGDGYPDVAVLCNNGSAEALNRIFIIKNNGDGTFNPTPIAYGTTNNLYSTNMVAGDFNKDGKQDIAINGKVDTGGATYGFQVLLGNGDGTLTAGPVTAITYAAGGQFMAVDFDGDGYPDLAVMYGYNLNQSVADPNILIYRNLGTGSFSTTPVSVATYGAATKKFYVAPITRGALPSIFEIGNNYYGSAYSNILVFSNQSSGSNIAFVQTGISNTFANLVDAVIGDFNGDGLADAAVYNGTNIAVSTGDGYGSLIGATYTTLKVTPSSTAVLIAPADENGDGYPDLQFYTSLTSPQVGSTAYTVYDYITAGTATAVSAATTYSVGSHTITATTPGGYEIAAGSAQTTLTISKPTPDFVISFNTTPPYYYGGPPVLLTSDIQSGTQSSANVSLYDGSTLLVTEPLTLYPGNQLPVAGYQTSYFSVGNHSYSASFAGDANYAPVTVCCLAFTIMKGPTSIAWSPAPASVMYGQKVTAAQLNAVASNLIGTQVPGTYSYNHSPGDTLPLGANTLTVSFTPTDTTSYASTTGQATINVVKATPTIVWVTPASIPQGTALSGTQLNAVAHDVNGATVQGSYNYNPAANAVLSVGTTPLNVTFSPYDYTDYNNATGTVNQLVTSVIPATTTTLNASPSPSQYGQMVTLTANTVVVGSTTAAAGTTNFYDSSTLLGTSTASPAMLQIATLGAGSHTLTASFVANSNFGGSTGTKIQTVNPATTVLAWTPNPATIGYGTLLSGAQLDASVSTAYAPTVAGNIAYTPALNALLTAGTQTLSATFTPTDGVDYAPVTRTVNITVTRATPTIVWGTPAPVNPGTALSGTQLNAVAKDLHGVTIQGSYVYNPPATTVLSSVGTTPLNVTFTPSDAVDYTTATGTVNEVVTASNTTTMVSAAPSPSQYGQTVTLTANAVTTGTSTAVSGSFNFYDGVTLLGTSSASPATVQIATLGAGTHNITATFAGNANNNSSASAGSLETVNPATTVLAWTPSPATIAYGTALSGTQLDATVSTAYAPTVSGNIIFTPALGAVLTAGTQTLSATFTPTDAVDYAPATRTVNITVTQATPMIAWATPASVPVGTVLSGTQLNAVAYGANDGTVQGSYAYNPASGTVLSTAGTTPLTVTFTPNDSADYSTATGLVNEVVMASNAPAPIPPTQVGSTSVTQTAPVAFTIAGTLGAINVLTQGAPNLDFRLVSGGTCAIGTAYSVGQTCTVLYSFTPSAPGQRLGGISLTLAGGSPLGTSYLAGTGLGPLVTFPSNRVSSSLSGGFTVALAVAEDGLGNLFVSDGATGIVSELTAASGYATSNPVGSGFVSPFGVAIDGLGNLFVADAGTSSVDMLTPADGYQAVTTVGSSFEQPGGVAVDGNGDLYVTDFGAQRVNKLTAASGYTQSTTLGSGFSIPYGVAVDGSGNVFVADSQNNAVKEILAQGGYTTVSTLGSGITNPRAVSLDAAGNLFVTEPDDSAILEILAQGGYTTVNTLATAASIPALAQEQGMLVDKFGNLIVGAGTDVIKLDYSDAPTLSFPATMVGSTSAAQNVTVANDGNAVLNFSGRSLSNGNFAFTGSSCGGSGSLASGTSCAFGVQFDPLTYGALSGTLSLTDNNLNIAGAVQSLPLSATGLAQTKSITFPQPASPVGINSTATLAATTSNGDPVTYSVISGSATILGSTITYNVAGTVTIAADSAATSTFAAAAEVTRSVLVQQSAATISWATPAAIPYGTALSGTQLNASSTVSGNFVYTPALGAVLTAGIQTLSVTFTAANPVNFSTVTSTVSLTVNKVTPTINWATPAPVGPGTALSGTQLNASAKDIYGATVSGNYLYNPPYGTVLSTVGTVPLSVTFTPTDTLDYNTSISAVNQVVTASNTTTSVVALPAASQYGQTVTLTANAVATGTATPLPGSFNFYDGGTLLGSSTGSPATLQIATLGAGTHNITASFAGNANNNGSTSAGFLETVSPATVNLAWAPTVSTIVYGTLLSGAQLDATVSAANATTVAGNIVYTPALGALLTAGTQTLSATFTATDALDFAPVTRTVTIQVTPATPTIVWTTPASVPAGTALSSTQLNATANGYNSTGIMGTFVYTPAINTVLSTVGTTRLNVVFTPNDAVDYTTAAGSVTLAVTAAHTTVGLVSSSNPVVYNQPFTLTATVTSLAGVPTGTVNFYNGSALANTAPLVNGVATYSPSNLTANTYLFTASYSGDSQNGTATSAALSQVVSAAGTTVSWTPTVASIVYGAALSGAQLNATSGVAGNFVYTPAFGAVLTAGTQTLSVTFTPNDTVNYKATTTTTNIMVTQAVPTIAWANPAAVVAGSTLSGTQLNATVTGYNGATLAGTIVYNPAINTVVSGGTLQLNAVFTPVDQVDYSTATGSVSLTVTAVTLTSLSSNTANLGDPAKTITLTGTGFLSSASVQLNGAAIATTFVNATTLTAVVPASNFLHVGVLQLGVVESTVNQTTATLPLTVGAGAAAATLNGPATAIPGAQPTLNLQLTNPYPVDLTVTLALSFTPTGSLPVDPAVQFSTGGTTYSYLIPANSTVTPPVLIATGTVEGTIRVVAVLTAGGANVTPANLQPLVIVAPAAVPGFAASLTRNGNILTVVVSGYSNTREVSGAQFHFDAAPGTSLDTHDLTLSVGTLFSTWFSNATSTTYGSTFIYTQTFNLQGDSSAVGAVTVTLVNTVGASAGVTTQ